VYRQIIEKVNLMMSQMKTYANFGAFLTAKREERDLTLREVARQMGVSAPFLSDVEKGRTNPLTKDRLDKVAEILHLDTDEKTAMFDLVGKQKNTVAPDLPEYIIGRDYVAAALRTARDLNAGEAEWLKFVEDLKNREG
jgi:transcriptional regulator with XRE-family HTH domain